MPYQCRSRAAPLQLLLLDRRKMDILVQRQRDHFRSIGHFAAARQPCRYEGMAGVNFGPLATDFISKVCGFADSRLGNLCRYGFRVFGEIVVNLVFDRSEV
jgi:hypothetical protein